MISSYSPELDEIKIFYSPSKAIERMFGVYKMVGVDIGISSSTFQPVREAWAAAIFLLGYSQITNDQYWLRENPKKHQAPDIFAIALHDSISEQEKGVKREVLEIEVCEYDENAQEEIPEHLKSKLKDKSYNKDTFLLCYIHLKKQARLIDIINGLKDIKTTVREIWLLFHLHGGVKGNFVIARVYLREADLVTTNLQYRGNYIELFKLPQKEMITTHRGTQKKVEFENLGYGYIPLPRVKKKKL